MNSILLYLDEIIPNPKCELNYSKDYELLISIVLSAQTTDKKVNQVTKILFTKYPSLELLKLANIKDLENIIKPIGTYKKKAQYIHDIANKIYDNNCIIPNNRTFLENLNGVGRKTTNVFLSEIYNVPTIAVDTHVARISKRLGIANEKDDVIAIERKLMHKIPKNKWSRAHHQLVLFGRYYCKAIKPNCTNCKLKDICKIND